MTVASGTRRGSALSTPSTSVQMTISDASSSAPKIDAEKSLPFRPRVVCSPSRVRAMKPVMMSVAAGSLRDEAVGVGAATPARGRSARAAPASICDDLPRVDPVDAAGAPVRAPAGSARTGASTRSRRNRRRGRGRPATRRESAGRSAGCRRCRGSRRSSSSTYSRGVAARRAACRRCRRGAHGSPRAARRRRPPRSAALTSASSASVTPRQAERTAATRGRGSSSRIRATRSMQAASATLDPPNLCTFQSCMSASLWHRSSGGRWRWSRPT